MSSAVLETTTAVKITSSSHPLAYSIISKPYTYRCTLQHRFTQHGIPTTADQPPSESSVTASRAAFCYVRSNFLVRTAASWHPRNPIPSRSHNFPSIAPIDALIDRGRCSGSIEEIRVSEILGSLRIRRGPFIGV